MPRRSKPRTSKLSHLRSLLWTIPAAMLATAVMITGYVVVSLLTRGDKYQPWFCRQWAAAVFGIAGAHVRIEGGERLDPSSNYVVVANHSSLLDIPVLMGWLPFRFRFLAKRELLKVPFIGWYLRHDGHLTVDRKSLRSSIESTNECARLIREKHLSVLIFPEGTRSPDGHLQRFRDGAAYLAIQSGVPLLPVGIVGTRDVLPARSSWFMPADIELRLGHPVPIDGLTARDRPALTARLEQDVRNLLAGPAEKVGGSGSSAA
jgi:1-acyl-sn-glycerol-3-phosphate acyltransferase